MALGGAVYGNETFNSEEHEEGFDAPVASAEPMGDEGRTSKVPGLPATSHEDPSVSGAGGDGDLYDEEPPEHVPGSFLSALPQFFVFPLILVITVTAIYLLLRTLSGVESQTAAELVAEVQTAPGDQSRWQAAYNLSDALRQGRVTLDDVDGSEIDALYDNLAPQSPELKSFLLSVLAYKKDAESTERLLAAALDDESSSDVRSKALYALYLLADPSTVPALAGVLNGPRAWDERFVAIAALGAISTPEAREVLADRATKPENGLEFRNLVFVLAQAGDPRAAEWLVPMLTRADYEGDTSILGQNFGSLSPSSQDAVRDDILEQFLVNACRAAESLGATSLIGPLQELRANDVSTKVKSAAIHALDALGGSEKSQ